jgi:hypothetical protein
VKHLFSFVRACGAKILGVMVGAILLSAPVTALAQTTRTEPSQSTTIGRPRDAAREKWHKALLATPRPKNGCFTATYPERTWREVPCKPSTPHKLYLPQRGRMSRTDIVGDTGPDFSATVTGHISQAEGSFDSATGVTSDNDYSLQLNTAPFQTTTCAGSQGVAGGGCQGWEQFVYESSGSSFIQYWLLNYGPPDTPCPMPRGANCVPGSSSSDGWCPFQFSPTGPVFCVVNAVNEPTVPSEPMTSLSELKVAGATAPPFVRVLPGRAAKDSITVTVGDGAPQTATGDNHFPDLSTQWNEAEFNVFGDGGGSQAVFNNGANLVVRTEVTSGTSTGFGPAPRQGFPPGCHLKSWTGESNNLALVNSPPVSPAPQPAPALVFSEGNLAATGAAADCSDALGFPRLLRRRADPGLEPR